MPILLYLIASPLPRYNPPPPMGIPSMPLASRKGKEHEEPEKTSDKEQSTMYKSAIVALLGLTIVLGGCGSSNSSNSSNINGNWSATLTSSNNSPAFAFTTSFTQMSGNSVNVTNLSFTTQTPCFVSDESETAAFVLSGNFNGSVMGTFQLMIKSGNPSGNTLNLQGNVKNNTITGTWTLTGINSGCSGSGNFTATRM